MIIYLRISTSDRQECEETKLQNQSIKLPLSNTAISNKTITHQIIRINSQLQSCVLQSRIARRGYARLSPSAKIEDFAAPFGARTRFARLKEYRQAHLLRLNGISACPFSVILHKFCRQRSHSCLLNLYHLTKNTTALCTVRTGALP